MGCGSSAASGSDRRRSDDYDAPHENATAEDDDPDANQDDYREPTKAEKKLRRHRIKEYRKKVLAQANEQSDTMGSLLNDERVAVAVQVLESAPEAALVIAADGGVLNLNPQALELFEHTAETFRVGNHVSKLLRLDTEQFTQPPQDSPFASAARPSGAYGVRQSGECFRALLRGAALPMGLCGGWVIFVEEVLDWPEGSEPQSQLLMGLPLHSPREPRPLDDPGSPSPQGRPQRSSQSPSSPGSFRSAGAAAGSPAPGAGASRSLPGSATQRSGSPRPLSGCPASPSSGGGGVNPARFKLRLSPSQMSVGSPGGTPRERGLDAGADHEGGPVPGHALQWIADAVITIDSSGTVLGMTSHAARLFNTTPEDARGRPVDSFLATAPEMQKRSIKDLVLLGDEAMLRAEEERRFFIAAADPTAVHCEALLAGLCEAGPPREEGKPPAMLAARFQVFHRVKRSALVFSLKGSLSEDMAAIFESTVGSVLITSQSGEILFCNEFCLQLLEYDMEDLHNLDVSALVPYPWRETHAARVRYQYVHGGTGVLGRLRGAVILSKRGRILPIKLEVSELATPQAKVLYVCQFRLLADADFHGFPGMREMVAAAREEPRNTPPNLFEERRAMQEQVRDRSKLVHISPRGQGGKQSPRPVLAQSPSSQAVAQGMQHLLAQSPSQAALQGAEPRGGLSPRQSPRNSPRGTG